MHLRTMLNRFLIGFKSGDLTGITCIFAPNRIYVHSRLNNSAKTWLHIWISTHEIIITGRENRFALSLQSGANVVVATIASILQVCKFGSNLKKNWQINFHQYNFLHRERKGIG